MCLELAMISTLKHPTEEKWNIFIFVPILLLTQN